MARIACVWIPHFVAEVELQQHASRPLIVRDDNRVLGACAGAAASGVRRGELLHRALARCPNACVVPANHAHYQEVWERVVEALATHSPVVEGETWDVAYLDARGMAGLYGCEPSWCQAIGEAVWRGAQLQAQLGVAGSKFAAWMAARSCSPDAGYQVVEQSDRSYLSSFPLDELPLSNETRRRLHLLGIHTMGKYARLPISSVAEQFGPQSQEAHRWARGEDHRPLSGRRRQVLEVRCEYDVAENRREPLLEALLVKSKKALDHLQRRGLTIRRITANIQIDSEEWLERYAWVGGPLGPRKLRTVLGNFLDSLGGDGAGVVEIRLKLLGLEPMMGGQLNLFAHAAGRLRLEETLRKLTQKHSSGCVCRARVRAPSAPLIEERYRLEEFPL